MTMQLAFCGVDCAACAAFHAAERLSMEERRVVADTWTKEYAATFTTADIDCVGCTVADGPHSSYCVICEIRSCGVAKAVETCAECAEYGCEKLSGFLVNVPVARANLEARRVM